MDAHGAKVTVLHDESYCILTGATGALGQELLFQLLEQNSDTKLLLVGRGSRNSTAEKRFRAIIRRRYTGEALENVMQRIAVVDGDVTEPNLGFSPERWHQVAQRTKQIIHCAAAVRFDQPIDEARQINYKGTMQVLELARAARKAGQEGRLDYISTAYVAGKRTGVVYEEELEHRKGFHNTYEQSKYETELEIRKAMHELPICVMRPSIIIGNSKTGETTNFKAFYWPIRVYAMGQMKVLPASRHSQVDLVPVDYVASAIVHLSGQAKAVGKTYHLTAGRDNLITIGEVLEAAVSFFKIKAPLTINPRFMALAETKLSHLFMSEHTHKTLQLGKPYYPYFNLKLEFDNSSTARSLNEVTISAPPVRRFFDTLFRYCVETDWGHKQAKAIEPESVETETETPGTGAVAFGR